MPELSSAGRAKAERHALLFYFLTIFKAGN
jgi:hypothetical protein